MTAVIENAEKLLIDKWGTLNTVASPGKLPDGHSPNNQNVWMDEKPGSVVTANGYRKLGTLPSGNPPIFFLDFAKSSDGSRKLILSDGITVYWTTDYVTFTTITTGLAQYFQLRGAVIRDKVWLTNGSDPVMTWDGTTLTTLDGTASTPNVPRGKFISYHDERVWLFGISGDTSALRFSELTDTSGTEIAPDNANAWPTDNELQISEADADSGTGMFLYRGYLYCSKQYSIWRVTGYDVYTYSRTKTRASTGTRFQESIQILDNLVHFIGVDGLYTFNGEDATRISDIIDPSSADPGVFAFRNLQQQLLNNQFWTVTDTADFNAGTKPAVLSSTNDTLTLVPADDTQADFEAGALRTNINTTFSPGSIRLTRKTTGTDNSNEDIASGQSVQSRFNPLGGGPMSLVGTASELVDSSTSSFFGASIGVGTGAVDLWILVNLSRSEYVARAEILRLQRNSGSLVSGVILYANTGSPVTDLASLNLTTLPNFSSFASSGPLAFSTSQDVSFLSSSGNPVYTSQMLMKITLTSGQQAYMGSFRVYPSEYEATGEFVSKTIDYGSVPATFGSLAATAGADVTSGTTYCNASFYTQSSSDGSTWDAAISVSNGGAIGSTLRRYLRWGASFTSTGPDTFVVSSVCVGGTYISEIHDAGSSINQWGAFQAVLNKAGQTVNTYYRAASTAGGVSAASWTAIVPGAIPNTAVTNQFIQIKIEMSTLSPSQIPSVDSFTVNWVLATGVGINTLQNVASIVILNRYWLSAATLGASENDIVIVKGKSTFQSPWHKKDFSFLSFGRFLDYYIAGSSLDGSIYRLETGYSKDGSAMDSFYETRDIMADNFQMKGREILVTADRTGPYDLNVGWSTDGGQTYTEKTVDLTRNTGDPLSFTKKLNIGYMSDSIRFRVRINAADQPFAVDEIESYYQKTIQRGEIAS